MKRLFQVMVMLLAVNFLAMAGGVGWLYSGGRLDKQRLLAIKDVLFPPPPKPAGPATQPATQPVVAPLLKLEELLARSAGRPAAEQLDYIRRSFDAQMAQLERAHRELLQLQRQVELAQAQIVKDRSSLKTEQQALATQKQDAAKLATDQGFQDSLALYQTLPAKQVKSIFMSIDDDTVLRYLTAMEPRTSAKITKEFKSAQELERLKTILEKMRQAQASVKE